MNHFHLLFYVDNYLEIYIVSLGEIYIASQGATYFCEPPILLSDDNLRTGGIAGEREHFLTAGD